MPSSTKNGVIHGVILGLDRYLQKYKQGPEAVIVNIASIAGVGVFPCIPIYCATKSAVVALTRSWGVPHHYDRTKVRVLAVCPGFTNTPLMLEASGRNLGEAYESWLQSNINNLKQQEPEFVADEVKKLIESCPNGSVWVIEGGEPAYQYIVPERETMPK